MANIRQKRDLPNGICKEAAEILKNKHVSLGAFSFLRKMKPMRQIVVAELLAATREIFLCRRSRLCSRPLIRICWSNPTSTRSWRV